MAKLGTILKYHKISDKEWDRMTQTQKTKKIQKYMDDKRKLGQEMMAEKYKNAREDMATEMWGKKQYGTRRLSNRQVRETLNKAGYNIKQKTTKADEFKKRFGVKK